MEKAWAEGQRDSILQGHLGPRGKIASRYSALQVNYWGNQKGKEHLDVQGRDMLWADSHTLHLSLCLSYLKEAPIFLHRCFSPKTVNKSTKLIAAVVLSVL